MKNTQNQSKATSTIVRTGLIALSLTGSLLVASPAAAASACKGLDNSACTDNTSCGWVEGYQRKDGRSVKSFCRIKSASKKPTAQKSTAKKLDKSVASK